MTDRIPFLRTLAAGAALALMLATGAAQAQDTGTVDDARLIHPGFLTVGTSDPVYPPWMMNDSPESGEGFENALVYALAAEMGFSHDQVQWVRLTFDQIIAPGDKPFDFAINQVSVTPARAARAADDRPGFSASASNSPARWPSEVMIARAASLRVPTKRSAKASALASSNGASAV